MKPINKTIKTSFTEIIFLPKFSLLFRKKRNNKNLIVITALRKTPKQQQCI